MMPHHLKRSNFGSRLYLPSSASPSLFAFFLAFLPLAVFAEALFLENIGVDFVLSVAALLLLVVFCVLAFRFFDYTKENYIKKKTFDLFF